MRWSGWRKPPGALSPLSAGVNTDVIAGLGSKENDKFVRVACICKDERELQSENWWFSSE